MSLLRRLSLDEDDDLDSTLDSHEFAPRVSLNFWNDALFFD